MNNYIFISKEGHTFQPNSNSIEPDCENEQVLGYAKGNTEEEAFKNLLINYDYLKTSNFNEVYCCKLCNESKKRYFNLKRN